MKPLTLMKLTTVLALFNLGIAFSQVSKLNPISDGEINKTKSLIVPNAAAEYLYNKRAVTIGYDANTNVFTKNEKIVVRMKIYHADQLPEDLKSVVIKTNYNKNQSDKTENISNFRMEVFNADKKGKLVPIAVKLSQAEKKQFPDYDLKTIALPGLMDGSIVEYQYEINSKDIFGIHPFEFQSEIPAIYVEHQFEYPVYLDYKLDFESSAFGVKKSSDKVTVPNANYLDNRVTYVYNNLMPFDANKVVDANKPNLKSKIEYTLEKVAIPGKAIIDLKTNNQELLTKDNKK